MRHDADETAETTDIRISCMVVHGEVGRAGLTEGDRRQSEPAATSSSSSSNVACRAQRGLSPLQAHRPGGQPAGRCASSRYQVLRQSNQQSVPCPVPCRRPRPRRLNCERWLHAVHGNINVQCTRSTADLRTDLL